MTIIFFIDFYVSLEIKERLKNVLPLQKLKQPHQKKQKKMLQHVVVVLEGVVIVDGVDGVVEVLVVVVHLLQHLVHPMMMTINQKHNQVIKKYIFKTDSALT